MTRINVRRQTSAYVSVFSTLTVQNLPGTGVVHTQPIITVTARGFMHHKDFQPGPGWIHVTHVQGIAVTETGGIQATTIVIYRGGTKNYFVPAICVHISHTEAVGALPPEILML